MKKIMVIVVFLIAVTVSIFNAVLVYADNEVSDSTEEVFVNNQIIMDIREVTSIHLTKSSSDPLKIDIGVQVNQSKNILYQIWGKDAEGWKLIKAYDENPNCTWTPVRTERDYYVVQARIKDAKNGYVCSQKIAEITYHDPDKLVIEKITSNAAEKNTDNTAVEGEVVEVKNRDNTQSDERSMQLNNMNKSYIYPEFTGLTINQGSSGVIDIKVNDIFRPGMKQLYKLTIGEQLRNPSLLYDYSNMKNFTWNIDKSGIYEIKAFVKDSESKVYDDYIKKEYRVTNPEVGNVKLDSVVLSKKDFVQPKKTTMTFNACASGGNQLLYSFWRLEAKGYRLIQDSSPINTFKWTPADSGLYTIIVRVKDVKSGSYEDQKSFSYTITDPLTSSINIKELNVSGNTKKGVNHVISAVASGSDNLMYKFLVKDDMSDWVTLQSFSPDNQCNWVPKHARNYKVWVWVKDAASGSYDKQMMKDIKITN